MPQPLDYKETMRVWVEDHMEPILEGSSTFSTVGMEREFILPEETMANYLWAYAMKHSEEVLG